MTKRNNEKRIFREDIKEYVVVEYDAFKWLGKEWFTYDIWNEKYRYNNESLEEWFERVCAGDEELIDLVRRKMFLFGGRALANRGTNKRGSMFNCYSSGYAPDDIAGLMKLNSNLALTYKAQGGQGISLSKIRPKGTPIGTEFKSDGIVPFMEIFNTTTSSISQGGARKGALMISIDIRHKEAETFITIKTNEDKITKANLSLEIDDEFMEAVRKYYETGEEIVLHESHVYNGHLVEYDVVPIKLYKLMVETVWDWGEPGCIFTNRFRNYNLMQYDDDYEIATCNPCLHPDTRILTPNGYVKIKDIVEPTEVCCMNNEMVMAIRTASPSFISKTNAETIDIELDNGKILKVTPDHKVFLYETREWIEADTLRVGDALYFPIDSKDLTLHKPRVKSITKGEVTDVYDISVDDYHNFVAEGVIVHNCGEQPLPKNFACNLGSLNLYQFVNNKFTDQARFDWVEFVDAVRIAVRALDKIIDENLERHALEEQKDNSKNYRNIGLGVFGYADALYALGLKYGSEEALHFTDNVFEEMLSAALYESAKLAAFFGAFPAYKPTMPISDIVKNLRDNDLIAQIEKYGLRNCSLLSVAPTGSIAAMFATSGGCEPQFALHFTRYTKNLKDKYEVNCNAVKDYLEANKDGDANNLPPYFVTSSEIDWHDRIRTQGVMQRYVDTAISSTVNLPNEATIKDIEQLYLYAWEQGLKGITMFRDGCKRSPILTTKKESEPETDERTSPYKLNDTLGRGIIIMTSDDCIGKKRKLITGCGSLHVEAFFDPQSGELAECYLSKGSTGGCNNFMIALSRMMSLAARGGIHIESIIDQLNSCGTCPSYAVRRATMKDTSRGSCCPMAVANALREMYDEMQEELGNYDEVLGGEKDIDMSITITHTTDNPKEEPTLILEVPDAKMICPECGETLRLTGGCDSCPNCGYSSCS